MNSLKQIFRKRWIVCIFLIYIFSTFSVAQKFESFSVALQTESISIPFTRFAPIHPGLELGLTIAEVEKKKSRRRWNAYLGWFYHENIDQNFYLRGEYQFEYSFKNTVSFFTPLSLGYMHSFHPRPVYEQNTDGSFDRKNQLGRPHVILTLGLGVSYQKLDTWEPFVKYEVTAQSPFVATVPVGPRSFFKVGTAIKLK